MDGVADERDRMAYVARGEFHSDESERNDDGRAENAGHAPRMQRSLQMSVRVRVAIVSGAVSVRVHVSDFNRIRSRMHTLLLESLMKWRGVPEAGASGLWRNRGVARWIVQITYCVD
jgi:hypothetical protein